MTLPYRGEKTTELQIEVVWSPLLNVQDVGNSAILSYGLEWNAGIANGPWISLVGYASDSILTSFIVSRGVTPGTIYNFRAQAKNIYGWGPYSLVTISATTVPSQMVPPATTYDMNGFNVKIAWTDPYTHSTMPITNYHIIIKDTNGVYRPHPDCDGTLPVIKTQRYCIVTMSSLRTAPFSLTTLGTLIQTRARSQNDIGWGEYSNANTIGAMIQNIPGVVRAPTRGHLTSTTVMNIEWLPVEETGGATIDSYNLQWDDGTEGLNWFDLQGQEGSFDSTLTYTSPLTQLIIPGKTYRFRVRAHNVHGWSLAFSTETLVLASEPPGKPDQITTEINNKFVRIAWSSYINNNFEALDMFQVLI